jgi:hypothetical protein
MSIRPIDMQVMLPKLSKMNQVKPKVVNRETNMQQIAVDTAQKESDKKMKIVTTFETKADPKVKNEKDGQSQGRNSGQSKQNKKEKTEKEKNEKEQISNKVRHIDIKV